MKSIKQGVMKKMKVFGKSIPVLAIVAIVASAGLASAVLVNYLSNTVTTEITVESPMVVGVSLGKASWGGAHFPNADWGYNWTKSSETITIGNIRGGETLTLYVMSANVSDAEITGFEEAIVSNPLGVSSNDFESVVIRTDSIYGDLGYGETHELITLGECHTIDANHVYFGSTNSTWGAGETDVTEIVVTFKANASGTYTFTYRVVPEI